MKITRWKPIAFMLHKGFGHKDIYIMQLIREDVSHVPGHLNSKSKH